MSSARAHQKPVRVAIIHYQDNAIAGGSLRVGETLAEHLDPDRVEAHLVFAYGGPGPVARRTRVPVHFLRAEGPADSAAWVRARAFFRKLRPDILHFMDPVAWLWGALAGTGYRKLLHVHGRYLPAYMSRRDRLLARLLHGTADGLVAITQGARRTIVQLGWARPDRIWTVHNAVDFQRFRDLPEKEAARCELGLPADARLLGMVCRLVRFRGCDDAIRLLRYLDHWWHLVLCGDGPFRGPLEAMAQREGVRERVHFTGLLGDVGPVYAALDGYLFMARYDPFGLATAEAMAAGVPVFGLGGDGEYREQERPLVTPDNAVFVERSRPQDYDGPEQSDVLKRLACRIQQYAASPQRCEVLAERARSWVKANFDARHQADLMTSIYESCLEGHREAP